MIKMCGFVYMTNAKQRRHFCPAQQRGGEATVQERQGTAALGTQTSGQRVDHLIRQLFTAKSKGCQVAP